jgi:hypothetical protein
MDDAEIVREATEAVRVALRRNLRTETVTILILAAMAFVGIGLLVYGVTVRNWQALVPGSISELAIVMPIRYLMRLRQQSVLLETMPHLLRLADTAAKKKLVFDFLTRLITQVSS